MISSIGEFEVKGELGKGGMGIVYLAHDPRIPRDVAIKVLTNEGDGDLLARFRSEAGTTAKLTHKNIVTIYAFGEQDGMPYIVMELLPGENLGDVISSHRSLTLLEKVRILYQVAEGLSFAHQKNVIHRDVKPRNIMLLPDGTAKVMDFGIARVTGSDSTRRTQKGYLLGTIAYMAPEQFTRGMDADQLVDIFAYGDVAYELITGQHPFAEGEAGASIARITSAEPRAIRELAPDCPEMLVTIIQQLLSKDRDLRYQTLKDLLLDIEPVLIQLRHDRAAQILTEAHPLVEDGQVDAALAKVKEALELDPMNREADQLKRQLQEVLRRTTVRAKVVTLVSDAERKVSERSFLEAVQLLEAALQLEKTDTIQARLEEVRLEHDKVKRAVQLLGEARRQSDLAAAVQKATEALAIDPHNTQAPNVLKRLRDELQKRERRLREALQAAAACTARQDFDDAFHILDRLAEEQGELPEIEEACAQVRAAQAEFTLRQRWRSFDEAVVTARAAMKGGGLGEARATIESLSSGYTDLPGAVERIGELGEELARLEREAEIARIVQEADELTRQGQFDAGHAKLDLALARYPGNPDLQGALERLVAARAARERANAIAAAVSDIGRMRREGALEPALMAARAAVREHPDHAEFDRLVGEIAAELQERERRTRIDEASRRATAILEADPFEAVELLRSTLADVGAEAYLESLLAAAESAAGRRREQQAVDQILAKAQAHRAELRFREAIEELERAIAEYPRRSELRLAASEVRAEMEQTARAERLAAAIQAIQKALAEGDLRKCGGMIDKARREFRGEAGIEELADELARLQRTAALNALVASVRESLSRDDVEGAARLLARSGEAFGATAEWKALKAETDRRDGVAQARTALAKEAFEEALSLLAGLQGQYPDAADLGELKAEVQKRKAESERRARLKKGLGAARELLRQKQHTQAIRALEVLAGEFPEASEVADLLASAREAERAEQQAQKIAEIERETEKLLAAKDLAGASAAVEQAGALYPADASIARLRVRVRSAKEGAEREKAARRKAAVEGVRRLVQKGQAAEAIASGQQALTEYPGDSELLALLSTAQKNLAEQQRSEAISRISLEVESQLKAGQLDRAQAVHEEGTGKFPGEPGLEALGLRIAAAQKAAARRRALQEVQDSIQALLQARQFERALEQVDQALKQDGDKALVRLKQEIESQWEQEKVRATLAQAREHLEAGRMDQAIALLEVAARECGDSGEIKNLLSDARARQKAAEMRAAIASILQTGSGLVQAGRLEEALQAVEEGLRQHGDAADLVGLRDRIAEQLRIAAEAAEQQRREAERAQLEAERKRQEEESRRREEAERQRVLKEREEARQREEAERARLEAERKRQEEEARKREEAERQRVLKEREEARKREEAERQRVLKEREEARQREEAERVRLEAERKRQEEEARKREAEEARRREEAERKRRADEDREAAEILQRAGKLRQERATAAALKLVEGAIARLGDRPALRELQEKLAADQQRTLTAQQTLERARAALVQGQIDVATQLASQLETNLRGEVDTRELRAAIAAKAAELKVQAAIEAVAARAESSRAQGRFEDALKTLDAGLREYPGAPALVSARERVASERQAFLREQARQQSLAELASLAESARLAPDESALQRIVARAQEIAAPYPSDGQFTQAAQDVSEAAARRRREWKIQAIRAAASRWRFAIAAVLVAGLAITGVIWKLAGGRIAPFEVSTIPPGAIVTAGKFTCTSPDCKLNLPAGSYEIQAQKAGYRAASVNVTIGKGKPTSVTLALAPLPTRLLVGTNFTRGTVTLDGNQTGQLRNGEFVLDSVPEGTHTLEIRSPEGKATLRFEQTAGQAPKILSAPAVSEALAIVVSGTASAPEIRCDCVTGEVTVDGKPAGKLEGGRLALPGMTAGTHQFRISAADGVRDSVVALQDSPSVNLFLAADRNVGTLVVEAGQDDVQVFLDNHPLTALTHDGLVRVPMPVKEYSVRVEKKGYRKVAAKSVEVKKGELARVSFKLVPLDAVLAIRGATARARVLMDGRAAGVTGADGALVVNDVAPGSHSIELSRDGYSPRRWNNLKFEPGATVSLGGEDVKLAEVRVTPAPPPPAPPVKQPPPAPDPRAVEAEEWDRVRNTRSVDQLEEFRRKYPTGANSEQAARRIEQIEWDNLQGNRDPAAFEAFANKYPNSTNAEPARRRAEELDWARVDRQNAGQIRAFLQRHPASAQAADANAALAALQQNDHLAADRRAVNQVLAQYQQAFGAKNLEDLLMLRPSLKGSREEKNIREAFRNSRSLALQLVPIREAEISGDAAVVQCRQTTQQTIDGAPLSKHEVTVTITLRRNGQTWTIQDIK